MKYGRITYNDMTGGSTPYTNIGDWCQTFAIDNIYRRMGIADSDIVNLNRSEISTYKGEKVLVVLQADCRQLDQKDIFPVSEDIIPVYLGIHRTQKKNILKGIGKEKELIACRDEETFNMFRFLGYDAFISGCLTATLPKRPESGEYTEVYLVDCPGEIEKYVPDKYKGHIHKTTHEIFNRQNPETDSKAMYEEYKSRAALVVTSRLHAAMPCMAFGIPVILVRAYYDDRYSFIEKFTRPYLPEEFSEIDWEVQAVDLEEHKEKLLEIAQMMIRIKSSNDKETNICCDTGHELRKLSLDIHNFFMDRNRIKYTVPFKTKMYWKISELNPELARLIRLKLLKRFTVIGK